MIDVYVFDCDGVIIDSAEDIADSANAALEHFGYWKVPDEKLISFVGDGAKNLVRRALDFSLASGFSLSKSADRKACDSAVESVLAWYKEYYYSHSVIKTTLYPGIRGLLETLRAKNKKIGMLTNKPAAIAEKILRAFEIETYFDCVTAPENIKNMKPSPEGLFFTLKKINEKYSARFLPENVIMLGDSAVDIIAGKSFGCKTCAITGGIGSKEKLLAENPDFSFPLASEIEKYIDALSAQSGVSSIENFAVKNSIPIAQSESADFICSYIKSRSLKRVLEIGGAIGCSAIRFAQAADDVKVTSIEIDERLFSQAQKNVRAFGLEDKITLINADALSDELKLSGTFDLIFIDAAKAQYIRFFEKYKPLLSQNGVIISDNLSFHGMVDDLSLTKNESTIQLVKKIRKYKDFLLSNTEFETRFYDTGDGISVSTRK